MRRLLPPLLSFILAAAAWQTVVRAFRLPPYILPGPFQVIGAARDHFPALVSAALQTLAAAGCGFTSSLAAGLLIAAVFSQSRLLRSGLYPYAIFLQTVPIVAIAPLIILWFDTGFRSVVIISFIVSLFPVITSATAGLLQVEPALLELFALHRASRLQGLLKLRLPNAVPHIVTGARIASGLSVIGAIVGEFFAGYGSDRFGLGYLIVLTSGQLKTDYLFAAILAAALLGLLIFSLVGWVGERVLSRGHYS